jgi:hypothetical protein
MAASEPVRGAGRWPLARWKPEEGPLHTLFCGVPTCSGVLGYAAPYRTRTVVLDPERPAKGLDSLTAHVFLAPSLRQVGGTKPPVFVVGRHAQRSPGQKPRRRAGVLFQDGKIESPATTKRLRRPLHCRRDADRHRAPPVHHHRKRGGDRAQGQAPDHRPMSEGRRAPL